MRLLLSILIFVFVYENSARSKREHPNFENDDYVNEEDKMTDSFEILENNLVCIWEFWLHAHPNLLVGMDSAVDTLLLALALIILAKILAKKMMMVEEMVVVMGQRKQKLCFNNHPNPLQMI